MSIVHAILHKSHFSIKGSYSLKALRLLPLTCRHNAFKWMHCCKSNWIYLFQIRAEKPYYMADPEVDSLVSTVDWNNKYMLEKFLSWSIKNFNICPKNEHFSLEHLADTECWQEKQKNGMKMHICISWP